MVPDQVRLEIMQSQITPMIKRNIKDFIWSRGAMLHASNTMEVAAKLLLTAGACVSFFASHYPDDRYMMISGIMNVGSISLFSLASYFRKESTERTSMLNATLRSIGIGSVPDVASVDNEDA